MRSRKKKKKSINYLVIVGILIGFLCYIVGYGHGQSSAYHKMNDEFNLEQVWDYIDKGDGE